jgi:excinuclease ABC subunit C
MPSQIIKSYLKNLPKSSGIYQFFDKKGELLYVGKAKNLKNRVSSYTKENNLSARISRMVFLAHKLEITQTNSEVEALLLEHNLIKKFKPKFNILLRDDKSFAQILITNHIFPQITKYRGEKTNKGHHFGPFASAGDVNKTIDILRKVFMLRNCSDAEFKSRKKPCLEYQIQRCTAPCTNLISQKDYQNYVKEAIDFLSGKSNEVHKKLTEKMLNFSANLEFEKAAHVRNQIAAINSILNKQTINISEIKDFDSIVIVENSQKICIYISFYRAGCNFGARPYFFKNENENLDEFLSNFLAQFYLDNPPPSLILVNLELKEKKLISEFLGKIINKKCEINFPKKAEKAAIIKAQELIALENLNRKCSEELNLENLHLQLKEKFNLEKIPQKIEVYDNSHIFGSNRVGALISASTSGFVKNGYRKFNIGKIDTDGKKDDTAMMTEVLTRRFSKNSSEFPDLIIIDGGKPQFSATKAVFEKLNIKIPFICMAKGENRNAGDEVFFHQNQLINLEKHSPLMHYLQRLRDEAHRFAIQTHRQKRAKSFLPK